MRKQITIELVKEENIFKTVQILKMLFQNNLISDFLLITAQILPVLNDAKNTGCISTPNSQADSAQKWRLYRKT